MIDYCRRAVEYDEADSVVLGCAGMADFCRDVSEQVGVPVIDGVTAGLVLVESMVKLGLRTSTRSEYAAPLPKDLSVAGGVGCQGGRGDGRHRRRGRRAGGRGGAEPA